MKNFTLALMILALGFGFMNQVQAQRAIAVTEMISPAAGSNIAPGVPTKYKFVIKNTGTETIGASDTILVGWGPSNGTQVALQTPVNMIANPHRVLAPNDTFHFTYSLNLSGVTGTFYIGFLASHTAQYAGFKGIIVAYNMTVGMDEQAKAINNVWFGNNSINYELIPKATCKANLSILNMNGQIVKDQPLSFTAGSSINESISMGNLPKGLYILSIQTPFGVDTKKFVVQ
jgi:hypothetical protein